jgi:hypothetical protein
VAGGKSLVGHKGFEPEEVAIIGIAFVALTGPGVAPVSIDSSGCGVAIIVRYVGVGLALNSQLGNIQKFLRAGREY